MEPNNNNATPAAPTTPVVEVSEVKKLSFWFSHLFVILATVIGVFLAANQGFKQALEFDNVVTTKNNYYLRLSLKNELADNIAYIKDYIKKVETQVVNPELVLETFVWDTMKYSSATLETPSSLLGDSQRFYRKAMEIVNTPYYHAKQRANLLKELVDYMEKSVLPEFDKDLEGLRNTLKSKKVDL